MDSIADFITRIKNAGNAKKDSVSISFSNIKFVIAEKLSERGFVGKVEKKGKVKPSISVEVLYDENGKPRITDVDRISKLSRRTYKGYRDIKPVRRGHGMVLVSTPKGVLTGEEAIKEKVGGEVLCTVW
ncbi:MAG: 30S ribosomal protein S8 [Candidatus Zambryskibacteria bacterium CG10_big_fil_rev_8_21_14_0_10_42_12]|uniref:Small ribosomal subunit protein uS8 n=1 Tax=Candidatus Zambryskibacteria bacterium CG10_big_fil_rev_8_21_14_0_10_42_12 TaxID=1975115 RepID=A0A2H0QXP8_9BACT|nr:MAG: 30S ribosomal protein S8 [Candidatus Zambryskibacteria bacterium CG10_big_fil_rev_8_21_14_0_10_42_12]